jgi:F0F1-type ATP synthase beta subunit
MLRHLYKEHLRGHDGFDEMIVAFSHPKNLRDLLVHTVLNESPGGRMSDVISSSISSAKSLREQDSENLLTTVPIPHTLYYTINLTTI